LLFSLKAQVEVAVTDSVSFSEKYVDYSDQLLIKIMNVTKSNKLEILNVNDAQSLKLAPLGTSSLGFGFNYKWLGLGVAFGLPSAPSKIEKYGKTKRFDFQLNIYSKKFVVDAFAQQYNGFYIENPAALTNWTASYFPQRDSMQTFSLGIGGYYVFNNKKLSYRAAYVRNAIQKKSAGSLLLGGFYSLDYAGFKNGTTKSFIPNYFPTAVQDSFALNAYVSKSFGISFGYTYTLVWKKFFINLSLITGIGIKNLTVVTSTGEQKTKTGSASRMIGRTALGYEGKHFLIGVTSYITTGTIQFENYQIKPSTSNVKLFIAKRFTLKKKK